MKLYKEVGNIKLKEKMLKPFYVKNVDVLPPRIHDLVRLADRAKVEFDEDTLEFLDAVNTFNALLSINYI